ncbi:hypothetical protein B296_00014217 [Ensete ventricosum]|uniref:Uncharacterized protein n=1 Tax=Ensete ventricosum TaxID=4639 RepID=A0A427AU14_ENSVE|nr:hypothetical protein B296_00014217 [Ensete ventricosum]
MFRRHLPPAVAPSFGEVFLHLEPLFSTVPPWTTTSPQLALSLSLSLSTSGKRLTAAKCAGIGPTLPCLLTAMAPFNLRLRLG